MKSFSAGIDIDTDPDAVWTVLVDTGAWPEFDPYCERIEGRAALGETLTAFSTLAPGRAFPLKVTTFERPKQMAWTGGMPLGVLKNVRTHTISPRGAGSRLDVNEVVSGPMLPMIARVLPDLTEPFEAFCKGLKARVEAQKRS